MGLWDLELFLKVCVLGFSGILFLVSVVSFYRLRSLKLLFVSVALFFFLIKGLLMVYGSFTQEFSQPLPLLILDIGIISSIYLATVR